MKVAVQGCSHGSLDEIYRTIETYTETTGEVVDLLLLCGDFQALRSTHDFASLAVPPKYFALGSFHEYYSGQKVAPVLTLVIGGNHEASNYMWELYHGGWLAPNIYYLGNTGCVQVDGLRVVGMSGIYKSNDYNKGHFETMPLDRSTMRSIYHIRSYDIMKVKQLPVMSPTITLSHDWPCSIYYHGDTKRLLRNKPFFEKEVQTDTLGSPPLLEVLKQLKPDYWFSAHLHVKFAAVYDHDDGYVRPDMPTTTSASNPDEIEIEEDEDGEARETPAPAANPDEITFDDEEDDADAAVKEDIVFTPRAPVVALDSNGEPATAAADEAREALKVDESADLVEQVRQEEGSKEAFHDVIGTEASIPQTPATASQVNAEAGPSRPTGRQTKFLALDKVLPGRDFIQFMDISTTQPTVGHRPRMTFDPHWLAITRVMHPFLSLKMRQLDPPYGQLDEMIQSEYEKITTEGLLVPEPPKPGTEEEALPKLVWEKGPIDVDRVQRFWPTAPAHGQPGGSDHAWYTNPQTEAFCGMLGLENKINPTPGTTLA